MVSKTGVVRFVDLETGFYVLETNNKEYRLEMPGDVAGLQLLKQTLDKTVEVRGQVQEQVGIAMDGRDVLVVDTLALQAVAVETE